MARKTLADDLLDAVKSLCFYLPFWAVPLLAVVVGGIIYWVVHLLFAELASLSEAQLPNIPLYFGVLAFILVFISGTLGWFERKKRKTMLAQTTSLEKLRSLSWREFEQMVGEAYRKEGHRVSEGPGNAADGGIDLETQSPSGERILIQCKHWKTQKIGVSIVREMLGVLTRENADRVVIMGTGYFTKEAQAWASGQPIELVDGPTLLQRLKGVDAASIISDAEEEVSPVKPVPEKEDCPQCGGTLVLRTAKRGPNAGNQFIGCSAYPKCRFTKPV